MNENMNPDQEPLVDNAIEINDLAKESSGSSGKFLSGENMERLFAFALTNPFKSSSNQNTTEPLQDSTGKSNSGLFWTLSKFHEFFLISSKGAFDRCNC